jgi:hypothetical protein
MTEQSISERAVTSPTETFIPARLLERDGRLIYSKVDEQDRYLTEENCMGYIVHTNSYFILNKEDSALSRLNAALIGVMFAK